MEYNNTKLQLTNIGRGVNGLDLGGVGLSLLFYLAGWVEINKTIELTQTKQ